MSKSDGYFEVARVDADIGHEEFRKSFVEPELPVIVQGVGRHWPARKKWTATYLQSSLCGAPKVQHHVVYYLMTTDALREDYDLPQVVSKLLNCPSVFPQEMNTRIWLNRGGNVSHWHYDADIMSVFNAQIKGRKQWRLISPDTPPPCYPFSNFAVFDDESRILRNKRHTMFTLEEGDMLYVPPLWFHSVAALDEENINLNWTFTKRETQVKSRTLTRQIESYVVHRYFERHPVAPIRQIYAWFLEMFPAYLVIAWRYDDLMDSPVDCSLTTLVGRVFKELGMLGKTLLSIPRMRAYLKTLDTMPGLDESTGNRSAAR